MCTWYASFNLQSFLLHMLQLHIYMALFPFHPFSNFPCSPCYPSLLPFVLPSTYLAPSSCDRNRPPSYQVACRLTLFAPPFTQLSHPFQIPRTPIAQRLTTTTLGLLRSHCAEHEHISDNMLHPPSPPPGGISANVNAVQRKG
jgi:hypothetical protein